MTKRRKWGAVPGLVTLAVLATVLSAYSGASSPQGRAPAQPIAFPHPVHVKDLGMNCLYCHFAADKAPDPGMPAVGTCMGCHNIVGENRPALPARPATASQPALPAREARRSAELAKLTQFARERKPIPWVRIHKVPDYVNFPHMRHVNAGVTCQDCHGPVQDMSTVYQFSSLNMGWCMDCHIQRDVRYDCSTCHY
jgi:hypothetical protein